MPSLDSLFAVKSHLDWGTGRETSYWACCTCHDSCHSSWAVSGLGSSDTEGDILHTDQVSVPLPSFYWEWNTPVDAEGSSGDRMGRVEDHSCGPEASWQGAGFHICWVEKWNPGEQEPAVVMEWRTEGWVDAGEGELVWG